MAKTHRNKSKVVEELAQRGHSCPWEPWGPALSGLTLLWGGWTRDHWALFQCEISWSSIETLHFHYFSLHFNDSHRRLISKVNKKVSLRLLTDLTSFLWWVTDSFASVTLQRCSGGFSVIPVSSGWASFPLLVQISYQFITLPSLFCSQCLPRNFFKLKKVENHWSREFQKEMSFLSEQSFISKIFLKLYPSCLWRQEVRTLIFSQISHTVFCTRPLSRLSQVYQSTFLTTLPWRELKNFHGSGTTNMSINFSN